VVLVIPVMNPVLWVLLQLTNIVPQVAQKGIESNKT
jgi:hypothetical protein